MQQKNKNTKKIKQQIIQEYTTKHRKYTIILKIQKIKTTPKISTNI